MPASQTRVVGSGFSVLRWQGQKIAYLDQVNDQGQRPVGGIQAIQPLDEEYPIEFAVPKALQAGSFTMTIRELWSKPVWQHLAGMESAQNLLDVYKALNAMPGTITCQTIIKPPVGNYWRIKTYHNVVIDTIEDGETIQIGAMTIARTVGCLYTQATWATVAPG